MTTNLPVQREDDGEYYQHCMEQFSFEGQPGWHVCCLPIGHEGECQCPCELKAIAMTDTLMRIDVPEEFGQ